MLKANLATIVAIIALLVGVVALALPGPVGPPGSIGVAGPQGIQGIQGVQGIQGATGPQGERGEVGPPGPVGPMGAQGVQGVQGEQGSKGDKGDKGDIGPVRWVEINAQASTSLRPTTYSPARNANITLYGSGHQGNVVIWLLDSGSNQFDLGSAEVSGFGLFQVTVKIPSGAKVGLGAIVSLCGGIPASSIAVIIQ